MFYKNVNQSDKYYLNDIKLLKKIDNFTL